MKVVILAGGRGTRMGSLTEDIPKPMVKLADKPLIEHQIDLVKKFNYNDISILTGYKGEVIKDYFLDGNKWNVKINYHSDPKPLGTSGSLKEIENIISDTFILLYGDTMIDIDFKDLLKFHHEKGGIATLLVHPNDHPFDSDLLEIDDNDRVTSFFSKPHKKKSYRRNLVNAALYVLSPKIFKFIKKNSFSDFGKDIFPKLISLNQSIFAYNTTQYIKDVGTIERLKEVESDFLSGKVKKLNKCNKQKAVFIDRDGVVNSENEPLNKAEKFHFLPGVKDAIILLNKSNFLSVLVTNQPIIAKGMATNDEISKVHGYMEYVLGKEKAYIDRIYYCPHHPDKGYKGERKEYKISCKCRKPETGMIDKAVYDMNIDVTKSFIIGDRTVDIMTGINANLYTILIRDGYAGKDNKYKCKPNFIFNNLLGATQFVVNGFDKLLNILNSNLIPIIKNNAPTIIIIGGLPKSGKSILSSVIKIAFENKNRKVKVLELENLQISNIHELTNDSSLKNYDYKYVENFIEILLNNQNESDDSSNLENTNFSFPLTDQVFIIEGSTLLTSEYIRKISNLNIYTEVPENIRKKREEISFKFSKDKIHRAMVSVEKSRKYANQIINMNF